MCTATWVREAEGYEVFFNRDELATRKPALPPSFGEREGVRFLAPVDGDAGGTWLGANERGVTVGLANGPPGAPEDPGHPFRSRGLLVQDLLAASSAGDVARKIGGIDPSIYRPFSLFAVDPAGEPRIWSSDGRKLAAGAAGEGALLFSSSRDAERARSERLALLERMKSARGALDPELLLAFHESHEPERGAFSPCMHREDAGTVSFSRIRVDERDVTFEYRPGSPCEHAPVIVRRLARKSS